MKIKTSELTGPALDWAVAKCENPALTLDTFSSEWERYNCAASIDWAQGGPIIEREKIKVAPNLNGTWLGQIRHEKDHPRVAHKVLAGWTIQHGPTPITAAMRCYVASKLGDKVEVPDGLL